MRVLRLDIDSRRSLPTAYTTAGTVNRPCEGHKLAGQQKSGTGLQSNLLSAATAALCCSSQVSQAEASVWGACVVHGHACVDGAHSGVVHGVNHLQMAVNLPPAQATSRALDSDQEGHL